MYTKIRSERVTFFTGWRSEFDRRYPPSSPRRAAAAGTAADIAAHLRRGQVLHRSYLSCHYSRYTGRTSVLPVQYSQ
jgi:hypothetical protein